MNNCAIFIYIFEFLSKILSDILSSAILKLWEQASRTNSSEAVREEIIFERNYFMELRILCKHLVADELNGKFTVGENSANVVGITLPRFYEQYDLSQFSFRITASGKGSNAAVQVLEMNDFDEESVHLLWNVTSDFTAIPEKFTLILTGVNSDNSVTIKFKSCPIAVNSDETWEFLPLPELSEQLLNQTHSEVQKAIDAANRAEKASQTPAPAEIYPATTTKLGGVKVDGKTITASEDGTISAADSENLKNEISEIKSIIGFTDNDTIGLHADFENAIFTRLGAAAGKNAGADFDEFPMYGGRKRCNVLDDGTITAYYGDDSFAEDGSNGQVMVYQPKFYYKVVPVKLDPQSDGYGYHLRCANYYISATPKIGFKLHPAFYNEDGNPVDYILFSAYEGSIFDASENTYFQNDQNGVDFSNDMLSSISGVKPCSGKNNGLTRTNIEVLAQNRGKGWHGDTFKAESANQMLMIIEFASFNMQSEIGNGVVNIVDDGINNASINTGITSNLGNSTGITGSNNGLSSISYRGMENPWGNMYKFISGLNVFMDNNQLLHGYIADDFVFLEGTTANNYKDAEFALANKNGYISAFGYSQEYDWTFIASEVIGTADSVISDYYRGEAASTVWRTALLGGGWDDRTQAGIFYLALYNGVSRQLRYFGGRIIYIPKR